MVNRLNVTIPRSGHLAIASVVILIILHFLILRVTPPGFYVDEALTGAHVTSMLTNGTDANGTTWPLFSLSAGGGYTTAVYLYPLVGWASIFGTGEYALRAFSTFITILAILITGLGVRVWTHNNKGMYLTWIIGLIMPWPWLSGSVAWDPIMLPLFVALAWLGFSNLMRHKNHTMLWLMIVGASLLLGAYVYPPFRASGPLLLVVGVVYAYLRSRINIKHILLTSLPLALLALPLLNFLLQPSAMGRTTQLSVFISGSLIAGLAQMIINYVLILNPVTLFITGDPNLRHSTGMFGMLGGVGLIGIIGLIAQWRKPRSQLRPLHAPLLIASVGVIIATLGSALTNEGQPHFLRATGAWPFFIIIISIGWQRILLMRWRYIYGAIGLCSVLTVTYIADLTLAYPSRSANAFDSDVRSQIRSGNTVQYPDSAINYYRNQYGK